MSMIPHQSSSYERLCRAMFVSGLSLCDRCVSACILCKHYASAILGIWMAALGWHMHSNTRYVPLSESVILSLPPNRITYSSHLFCSSVAISAQCGRVCIAIRPLVVSGMVKCDKSGKSCFWYGAKKWDECVTCGWTPDDWGVHKKTGRCAACFEEATNAEHERDGEVWPSCRHEECLQKTIAHRSKRDTEMNFPEGVPVRAPPTHMYPPVLPQQALTMAGSSSSACTTFLHPPPPPYHPPRDVQDIHAEMEKLRGEVQTVLGRMEDMMELLDNLRQQVERCIPDPSGWRYT
jgi:hypothetical protein